MICSVLAYLKLDDKVEPCLVMSIDNDGSCEVLLDKVVVVPLNTLFIDESMTTILPSPTEKRK